MRQLFGNPCQASPDSGERAQNLVVSHERKGWGTENVLSPTFPVENMCTELQQNPGGQNLATVSHVRRREHSILDLESPWKQQEMLLTHPHCQLPGQYPTHSKCFIHDCLVDKPQSPRLLNMTCCPITRPEKRGSAADFVCRRQATLGSRKGGSTSAVRRPEGQPPPSLQLQALLEPTGRLTLVRPGEFLVEK